MLTKNREILAVELSDNLKKAVSRPQIGTPAPGKTVSVDTPLHEVQRPLHERAITKYIDLVGTIDWNLFGYVTAVRYPDKSLAIIDGQHRISLVKTLSPQTKEVPAHIIDVKNDEYAALLFAYLNGVAIRKVSNEELLWAEVIARDPVALDILRVLKLAGVSCGQVNAGHIKVSRVTFVKCMKLGEAETILAVDLIKKAYPGRDNIDLLLHGLVKLLSIPQYAGLSNNLTLGKMFREWMTDVFPLQHDYKEACFKQYQNNSQWQIGIAYGLMEKFQTYMIRKNKGNHCPAVKTIKDLYLQGLK